jgi:TRAP-type C4-dicarboxylate transport system permease small subunit
LLIHAVRIGEHWHRHDAGTGSMTRAALTVGVALVAYAVLERLVAWADARETRAARKESQG